MPAFGKRRALGQHFLRDQSVIQLIANTAVEGARQHGCQGMLEIGPGKGAITAPIIEALKKDPLPLVLSERDRKLAEDWRINAGTLPFVRVEEGDFLDLPEEKWLDQTPLAVASNLPYSAGTAIVTRLARHPERIPIMVLMFQAEVAQRLRAEPESKSWGSLSVWIQNRWDVRKLCFVPPKAFNPPPDVDSEVVVLTPRAEPHVAVPRTDEAEKRWEGLLKACFAHRRKMLRSSLPPQYKNALERSGVDGTKRAEALSWEEWQSLFRATSHSG